MTSPYVVDGQVVDASQAGLLLFGKGSDSKLHPAKVDAAGDFGISPAQGALTDRSGTITSGGAAQNAMAANTSRKYLFILNPATATEVLWFNLTTTATAASPSIQLAAGQSFVMEAGFVSTAAVSVIAATTGHAFTALEG